MQLNAEQGLGGASGLRAVGGSLGIKRLACAAFAREPEAVKAWGEQDDARNHGWLMLSYRHDTGESSSEYQTLTQGDMLENKLDGSRVGLSAGYDRRAGKNTFVNVQLNAEQGLGGASGLRAVGGSLGIKRL
ncbi:hypothetical protein CTI14_42020, partial [Methylobacterium radiotolerans]